MLIRNSEQSNPRYIYIDPRTNTVHLLVPITLGTEISLDNTCKTVLALQEFFGKKAGSEQRQDSALHELLKFKKNLECDIAIYTEGNEKQLKIDRLKQVQAYINTLNQIGYHPVLNQLSGGFPTYPEPIQQLLTRPASNLYAMHLRPSNQDGMLCTQNPVFAVNRQQQAGTFYHALINATVTHTVSVTHLDRFTTNCVSRLLERLTFPTNARTLFPTITQTLVATHREMFGDTFNLDFSFSQENIDVLCLDADIDSNEIAPIVKIIIDLSTKANAFPLESSFNELTMPVNKEKLSIMVQFLVGEINIYARSKGLTQSNFGTVLDNNPSIASNLATDVKSALENGHEVEQKVCEFINSNQAIFGLKLPFTSDQMNEVFVRFNPHYQLVKRSPHMDDFMILDPTGASDGRFFTHQNNICFDFADLLTTNIFNHYNRPENARARDEIPLIPGIVPARESAAVGFYDVDLDVFKTAIKEGLQSENFAEVRKILSVSETDRCVFEVLGREFFAEFEKDKQAEQLFIEVRRGITDAAILNRYNIVVRGIDSQILLTPVLARKLYVAVADTKALTPEKTLQYSTVDAVKALLSDLGIKNIAANAGYNGDIVIDTTRHGMEAITTILDKYTNAIHLTNSMAASLYKQVETSYEKTSPQYLEMMALSNRGKTPEKLIKALKLLHIAVIPENISYPDNNKGNNGYIFRNIENDALHTIEEIHEFQANRFVVTSVMENALYDRIRQLDNRSFTENLSDLDNNGRPDKLETALVLLGIIYRRVEFNGGSEYVVYMPFSEQAKIKFIANLQILNNEEKGLLLNSNFKPTIFPLRRKSTRGYITEQIRARARQNAGEENAEIARREIPRSRFEPSPLIDVADVALANHITVSRVHGFGRVSTTVPSIINPRSQLNCPNHILVAFQQLLRGSRVPGSRFTNPYSNQVEQFPDQVEQLTPRHLQILARLEVSNTDGIMKTQHYNSLLNDNKIAVIRALVKATTVAGITYAERVGGYPNNDPVPLNPHHKVIVIDQSGFQWQGDKRNTGGLFFYPDAQAPGLPAGYAEWQRNTYQAMYNAQRPENSANQIRISWLGTPGQLDLSGIAFGIEMEFTQALDAAVAQGQYLDENEKMNFAFLKAGMGFFANGLDFSGSDRQRFEEARLQGILNALQTMQRLPQAQRALILGKVGRIELPYSGGGNTQLLDQIRDTVIAMDLQWGGAENINGYFLRQEWVTAVTNCGDPHAMPSNEGGYQSVDAEMGANAYLDHLNAAFNDQMTIRLTTSFYPLQSDAIIVIPDASLSPVTIPVTEVRSNIELIEAALLQEINRLLQVQDGTILPGTWCINGEIQYGCSNHTGLLGFANDDYQVNFEADNSISVQNKRALYRAVTGDARAKVLSEFCERMNLQINITSLRPTITTSDTRLEPTMEIEVEIELEPKVEIEVEPKVNNPDPVREDELKHVRKNIEIMQKKRIELQDKGRDTDASIAAKNLCVKLTRDADKYARKDIELDVFKQLAEKAIKKSHEELDKPRGYCVKHILANLAFAIVTLGSGYLVYAAYKGTFFPISPNTDSTNKVNDLDATVNNIGTTVG